MNSLRITITPTTNQLTLHCTDITVVDDLICEADETIPILLNSTDNPSGIIFSPSSAVVTIEDDEGMFFVYIYVIKTKKNVQGTSVLWLHCYKCTS